MTLSPCFDPPPATCAVADAPIVYADHDVARLLAEVERRSGRHRRHQRRGAQSVACLVVALLAWLSWAPTAGGEVQSGHYPAAVTALEVGHVSQSGK